MKYIIIIISILFYSILNSLPLLDVKDATFDDFGNGKVIYPDNPIFEKGIFDITEFKIEENSDSYKFTILVRSKIHKIKNTGLLQSNNIDEDFYLPLIQFYLVENNDSNLGNKELLPGINANLAENFSWNKVVVFSPISSAFESALFSMRYQNINNVIFPEKLKFHKNIICGFVSKEKIKLDKNSGFLLLMLGHNFSSLKNNAFVIPVKSVSGQYNFGGGEKNIWKRYNSNIIDMICSPENSQKKMLSSYNQNLKKYAQILPYYKNWENSVISKKSFEIKEISGYKIIVNAGSKDNFKVGDKLLIDNRFIAIAKDVFTSLSIAEISNHKEMKNINKKMKVQKFAEKN